MVELCQQSGSRSKSAAVKTRSASSGGSTYVYDGDGHRVKKIVGGPTTVTTVFVYDVAGQMIAEYSDHQQSSGGTSYVTADHLGTPRVITNGNASVSGRHDYQPFGEEIPASYGGRASVAGYPPNDNLRQQFTLKERDIETGLDYFGARYYASMQGRFISPDKPLVDQQPFDPQSWNLYTYARNNPLYFVDPNGEKATVTIQTNEKDKTGTIVIQASFAIYAVEGSEISQEELQKQAAEFKSQIEETYQGTFSRGGFAFTVSAEIQVNVFNSEREAIAAGKDNIAGFVHGDALLGIPGGRDYGALDQNANAWTFRNSGESFDRMLFAVGNKTQNTKSHEFAHGLGEDREFTSSLSVLGPAGAARKITSDDFHNLFGRTIDKHLGLRNGVLIPSFPMVEAKVLDALNSLPTDHWLRTDVELEILDGELILFDAACPFAEIDNSLTIRIPQGCYIAETLHFNPNEETSLILHRFVRKPA